MSKFKWSASKRRYIYASNGRVVPETRIRAGLQSAIDASKATIDGFTQDLIGGRINLADWTLRMRDEIKNGHRAAALLANGGKPNPSALGKLGATVRAQYEYLSRFSSAIQNGEVALDARLIARSKMYAQAILPSYENQVRAREQRAGSKQERRVLSPAEHCADCVEYARRSWQPIGTLPQIGDSICRVNCHCRFEYRGEGALPLLAPAPVVAPPPPTPILDYAQRPPDNVSVNYTDLGRTALRNKLGRDVSDQDLAWAVGALDDSELSVYDIGGDVYIRIKHPLIESQDRYIKQDARGRLYIENNDFIKAQDAPRGVGLQSFARQVFGARNLGAHRIAAHAAGTINTPQWNGYYTWPRLGYNAPLTAEEMADLPPALRGATDLHELFERGGAEYWKQYGSAKDVVFDLSDGSDSVRRLLAYIKEKELEKR